MNINEILTGSFENITLSEQEEVLEQMKAEKKVFDLSNEERYNLITFLCEKSDSKLAIDYLFFVLDTEISYPIDDEKVKLLFADERMMKLKKLMMDSFEEEDKSNQL
jgi:hypothetical protein